MKDYSQHKEQEIILNYFGENKGSFIDIGANDGVTFSNVYALALSGWGGIAVEASPKAYSRLVTNYTAFKNIDCVNVAVGTENKLVDFYESGDLIGEDDVSLVSSLKESELKRWQTINSPGQKVVEFEKITVSMINFKTLLTISGIKKADFITIDIEGMELEVLPQIDFNELETKLLCVENNGKDADKFDNIILPFGFTLIAENRANRIYGR